MGGEGVSPSEEDLRGLAWMQSQVVALLEELKRIAGDAGFAYYLAYGTAIGALRDGDLIAWDPDADVLIPIDDYRRALRALERDLSPAFELLRPAQGSYEHLFARLAVRGIDHSIIRVDLFQLCAAPRTGPGRRAFTVAQRAAAKSYMVKKMSIRSKAHYSAQRKVLAACLKVVLLPVRAAWIAKAFESLHEKRLLADGATVLTNPSGAYGAREYFDAAWFTSKASAQIRGTPHPLPGGFDPWLRQVYGDYLVPLGASQVEKELAFVAEFYVQPLRRHGHLHALESGAHVEQRRGEA